MNNVLPTYPRTNLNFTHGEGSYLYEVNGDQYLDFGTGIAVNSLGYSHKYLNDKLKDQIDKLWHLSNVYQIPQQDMLAKRLCELCFADYVFFCNSGAEAVEASIKIARRFYFNKHNSKTKNEIITFSGSFHGRTIGSLAAGGPSKLDSFNTEVNGFKFVPFGDRKELIKSINKSTAAIIIEPIQGEGGIRVASEIYLAELRKICDENDTLLIFDEVQCGIGRTGKFFAYQWTDVRPDIMTIAKAIGNGFPLGACLTSKKVGKHMDFGSHGSTFGGNPLACSVGNAVLDVMTKRGFLESVNEVALELRKDLEKLAYAFPGIIEEIRGKGFILGIKCKVQNLDFVNCARENYLLTIKASDNVVRLLPPINLTMEDEKKAIEMIKRTCEQLS